MKRPVCVYIYIYIYIMDKICLKNMKRHNKNEIAMSLTVSRRSHTGDPSSITGPVSVRHVLDTVVLGQVLLRVLQFLLVIIILPMLHAHLHLHVVLTKDRRAMLIQKSTSTEQKCSFISLHFVDRAH